VSDRVGRRSNTLPISSIGYLLAVGAGLITAVQSRVNGGLADFLGSGISAALVNFAVGLALVLLLVLLVPRSRRGVVAVISALRTRTLPWWVMMGGVFGAFFITIQSTSVPVIGVALFSVAVISGQTVSSLLVDRLGIGTTSRVAVTPARIIGAVGATLAVFVAVIDQWGNPASGLWLLVGLSFLAGLLVAVQQAVNGRVSITARSAPAATLGNFLVGAATLAIVIAVSGTFTGSTSPINAGAPAWTYVGGIMGVAFIGIAAFTVPILGVLSFALIVIAAQLAGALVLDVIWPATDQPVTIWLVTGAALAASAAFIGRRHPAKSTA
jgi:transporter family-2 protein